MTHAIECKAIVFVDVREIQSICFLIRWISFFFLLLEAIVIFAGGDGREREGEARAGQDSSTQELIAPHLTIPVSTSTHVLHLHRREEDRRRQREQSPAGSLPRRRLLFIFHAQAAW
jgi:hypothetical protein